MKTRIISLVLFGILFSGCLVGHKISYEIDLDSQNTGIATVRYTNIRSDAVNNNEFQNDQNLLFDYMLKSEKFVDDMKKEGREIIDRNLYLENGKLTGEASFKFKNLMDVEGIAYEDGFYFLTLDLADSVISTNGAVIKSPGFKRILWDSSIKKLKFEIYTEPETEKLLDLAPLYQPQY